MKLIVAVLLTVFKGKLLIERARYYLKVEDVKKLLIKVIAITAQIESNLFSIFEH
jgi:hypothetical protein